MSLFQMMDQKQYWHCLLRKKFSQHLAMVTIFSPHTSDFSAELQLELGEPFHFQECREQELT